MVSSNALLAGVAALGAAEATGVTNVTPIGEGGSSGDGSSGGEESRGLNAPQVAQLVESQVAPLRAAVEERSTGEGSGVDPSILSQIRNLPSDTARSLSTDAAEAAAARAASRTVNERLNGVLQDFARQREKFKETVENARSGSEIPGVSTPDIPGIPGQDGPPGPGPSPRSTGPSGGDGFDLQDLAGEGRLGTAAAVVGESGVAAGSTVDDLATGTADVIGRPGKVLSGDDPGGILGWSYDAGRVTGEAVDKSFNGPVYQGPDPLNLNGGGGKSNGPERSEEKNARTKVPTGTFGLKPGQDPSDPVGTAQNPAGVDGSGGGPIWKGPDPLGLGGN